MGDCGIPSIPDKTFPLTVTDMPFGKVNRKSNGLRNLDKGTADIETFDLKFFISEICRVTNGSIYVFCATEQLSILRSELIKNGMSTRVIVWEKTNPSPMNGQHIWLSGIELCVYGKFKGAIYNGHCENTVLKYPCGRNKLHPTQKPVKLMKKLIEQSSNVGDIVFDPCMGSGTTAEASLLSGRNFFGFEKDKSYFNICNHRIKEITGRVS